MRVLITGTSSGIGKAIAEKFLKEGFDVTGFDRKEASISQDSYTHFCLDIRDREQYPALAPFDIVINNAGVLRDRMFLSLSEEDWDMVMRVHLRGHFCMAKVFGGYWRDQKKAGKEVDARIINTSSGAGLQGSIGQSNYVAAKGGIAALTLVQAAELGRYGITVNSLAPAARTAMTEAGMPDMVKKPDSGFDIWDPLNVASIVVWLGSAQSAHVTGRCFEAKGGEISVADGWHTGKITDKGARWEPAELGAVVDRLIAEAPAPQKVYGT